MAKRSGIALLLVMIGWLMHAQALAAEAGKPYADAHFQLVLPEGYLGPAEHVDGASVSKGFRKPYAGTSLNTVILITVHDFGPSFAKRSTKERNAVTRETLDDIVAGIEKNRSGFRKGEARAVTIAGHSGVKVAWSGTVQGIAFDGLVYCVLSGSRAYAIQIQDPSGRDKTRMAEAARAVERMRLGSDPIRNHP